MTNVTLSHVGERYSVEAIGHAEGSAQACAAVSTIMFSVLGYLSNVEGIEINTADFAEGFFSIEFSGGEPAQEMYDFCTVAFLQLEKSYSEYVTVSSHSEKQ